MAEAQSAGRWIRTGLSLGLPILFVLVPILSFVLYSFWHLDKGQIVEEFTLDNYRAFFTSGGFLQVYAGTILLCLQVTIVNVALGIVVALFLSRRSPSLRFALLMLFVLPLFMSYIIKIYAIRGILGQRGLLNEFLLATGLIDEPVTVFLFSRPAILLTLMLVYLPFAILPIYLAMERIPANIYAASADLGGSLWSEIRYIVLPLSTPGIVVAAMFTFVLSLGDFVTPQMVGGTNGFTFGRIVYSQFGLALNWPLGAALAVILLGTALFAVALAGAFVRRRHSL